MLAEWLRSRRWIVLFLGVTLTLLGILGFLTWRLIEQDRVLEVQQTQERLNATSDLVATQVQQQLGETARLLTRIAAVPAAELESEAATLAGRLGRGAFLVVLEVDRTKTFPAEALPYSQSPPPWTAAPDVFGPAEQEEFQRKNYAVAREMLRPLAASSEPEVRAGALLRIARNLRKEGQLAEALSTYLQLANLGQVGIAQLPAELVARYSACQLLEEAGETSALQRSAARLYNDLLHGHWRLPLATFRFYQQETLRWYTPSAAERDRERDVFAASAAVDELRSRWASLLVQPGARAGAEIVAGPVLIQWSEPRRDRLVALVGNPTFIERSVAKGVLPLLQRHGARLALLDGDGRAIVGSAGATSKRVTRTRAETGLPWTLQLTLADSEAGSLQFASRRRIAVAGFSVVIILVLAGSYLALRSISRELEVARMQSDFVAAVSHDFRTPLAAIRQISELLAEGRVSTEERKSDYYERLGQESGRLQRLVEGLLDFTRMEVDARPYRLDTIDGVTLVRSVVGQFKQEVRDRGYDVELTLDGGESLIRADVEALSRALWNLLENAVKYSPDERTIHVSVHQRDGELHVAVEDQGVGIPRSEQRAIFRKFVRASNAVACNTRGTGLGLAMVRQIMTAHGGSVRVESEPGVGSRFTLVLPAIEEHA